MSDKIEILMTVRYDDLILNKEGLKQALDVVEEQIKYYPMHPVAAFEDAKYIMENMRSIMERIHNYIPQTKTLSEYNQEQEVFDLLFGKLVEYYEENVPGFSLQYPY